MTAGYRVGIIGAGEIAYFHAAALATMPEAHLAAVCDLAPTALVRFGDTFGVGARYDTLASMLAGETLDVVIVATWGVHHAAAAEAVARTGRVRAILCEKPISLTAEECRAMVAVARDNGVLLAEAFKFRHHPQHVRAKEIVDGGGIGTVRSIVSTFSSPLLATANHGNWRFDPARGGGSTYDTACYNVHHARHIVGAEPERVFAVGQFDAATGIDHTTAILLEFPGGVTAQIATSYAYCFSQSVAIHGTAGALRMERAFNLRQPWRWTVPDQSVSFRVEHDDGTVETHAFPSVSDYVLQPRHLCACLTDGTPHRIPPEDSIGNMRVLDAVRASMTSGEPQYLKERAS